MGRQNQTLSTAKKGEIPGIFHGPILKQLIKLSLPIFAGMMFHLLYNITDTFWISRIDLKDPSFIGAMGLIFPIIFLAFAISNGLMIGISSLVSRSIGEKNKEVLEKTAESGLFIALILSIIIITISYLFSSEIISMLGGTGKLYKNALNYFLFIIPAASVMLINNVLFGILQGEGQMKYVMKAMIIGTITNIVLDPIFIFGYNGAFKMDLKGAAIATCLAQFVSFLYILSVFLRSKSFITISWKTKNINFGIIKKIAVIGLPQTMGQATMSFSFIIFNKMIIYIDKLAVTSFTLCGRIDSIIILPIIAISTAVITMMGQNFGRGNYQRVFSIWRKATILGIGIVLFLATILFIFAPYIYSLFTEVAEVLQYSITQTRILVFSMFCAVIGIIGRSAFQSIGLASPAIIIPIFRLIIFAVPIGAFLAFYCELGFKGIIWGIVCGNIFSAIFVTIWLNKKLKKILGDV